MHLLKSLAIIIAFCPLLASAKVPDLNSVHKDLDQLVKNIENNKSWIAKFELVKNQSRQIDRLIKDIKEPEYNGNEKLIFELFFYQEHLEILSRPFKKENCATEMSSFKVNFVEHETGKVPPKIKPYSDRMEAIIKAICK